ncbi:MAG: DNA repair protein RadC [Thermoplasmata archaeon]
MKKSKNSRVNNPNAGHRSRLRERFKKAGLCGFHDYEVIEFILSYAIPRRDVKPLAKALINRFGGLRGVLDASIEELQSVGTVEKVALTERIAILLKFVKDTASAYLEERIKAKNVMSSTKDVLNFCYHKLAGDRVEKFLAIYLNARNEVLGVEILHEGTIDQTAVYPRTVIERALKNNACAIIFVHNHPSGDPAPSEIDRKLTQELERAASAMDIAVHDHIIIGKNSHFSGRKAGWLSQRKNVLAQSITRKHVAEDEDMNYD